jgi:hypothetical protein
MLRKTYKDENGYLVAPYEALNSIYNKEINAKSAAKKYRK